MSEPGIDLTGKLIIKVALGDDIRRILITNEDITYDELVLMMQRVYRGKLNSSDDIVIKYKDEDNDLITIFDSSDLSFAIQCSRILKITLYVNGKPEPLQSNELKLIKGELRLIRDRCTQLLDKLDSRPQMDLPSSTVEAGPAVKPPKNRVTDSPRRTTPQPSFVPVTSGSKEFDPLSSQRSGDEQSKVMSSFGIGGGEARERSGSADSISSLGSASIRPQPGTPTNQPQQGAYQQGGSGQKLPPWQQQQPVTPSAYSQGQQQVGCPVVMSDQKYYSYPLRGLTSTAGRDSPQTYKSMQHYHHSLMQAHMYTGHEDRASPSPLSPAQQPTPKSYSGSPAPAGQPQQAGYPGQQASSGQPQAPPQSQQQPQGGGGAFTPIAPPAGSQPQAHPGYPQGAGLATVQASGQGPVSSPFSGQFVPQGTQPGQPVAPQPGYSHPGMQQQPYPTQQVTGGQPAPGTQPQQFGGGYQTGPLQAAPAPPGPAGSQPGNPYARQGPGYGGGYPRPSGNYPQGYQ
ncbi:protein TFG-like isoform X2 [Mya arenaria]|uniref:protein TFG-like isoform X2 n=1 Tax=Mya arenaria TaxID=6604 RepID=UPI0022E6AE6F|nr:protein TFG-like isoform X2 [Mya arenaria]